MALLPIIYVNSQTDLFNVFLLAYYVHGHWKIANSVIAVMK